MASDLSPARLRDLVDYAEMHLNPMVGEFMGQHDLTLCETVRLFAAALEILHCTHHAGELAGNPEFN